MKVPPEVPDQTKTLHLPKKNNTPAKNDKLE